MGKIKQLSKWYNSKSSRQINILRLSALLACAIPIVGWIFITPWLIPLMLYLEFHYVANEDF